MNPKVRFLRHGGIYRSDEIFRTFPSWDRVTASGWSAPGPATERDRKAAPCCSSAMSSGRLFLDRDARQHCPLRFTGRPILKPFRDRAQEISSERRTVS